MKLRIVTFSSSSPIPGGPHWSLFKNGGKLVFPGQPGGPWSKVCSCVGYIFQGKETAPLSTSEEEEQTFPTWQAVHLQSPLLLLDTRPCSWEGPGEWRNIAGDRDMEVSCRAQECSEKGTCFSLGNDVASKRQHSFYGTAISHSPSWLQGAALGSLSDWALELLSCLRCRSQQGHLSLLCRAQGGTCALLGI